MMMKTKFTFAMAALLLALAPVVTAADKTQSVAENAFHQLKNLAGKWEATMPGKSDPVIVTYKVTSGGNTVLETIMPGTPHEMLTLFHLDDGKLVLTHYCAVGNQPRMQLVPKSSGPEHLAFDFIGGANIKPSRDGHMHALRMRFESQDKIVNEWDYFEDGKLKSTEKFQMTRVRE